MRLGGLHLRLGRQVILRRVVQILLGDGLLLHQRNVPVRVQLGSYLIRLRHGNLRLGLSELRLGLRQLPGGLRQLPLRLIHHRLERPRIDFEQQLPGLYEGAFACILRHAGNRIPAP